MPRAVSHVHVARRASAAAADRQRGPAPDARSGERSAWSTTSGGSDSAGGGIASSETGRSSANRASRLPERRTDSGGARARSSPMSGSSRWFGRSAGARHRSIVPRHRPRERRDVVQVRGISEAPGTIGRASAAPGGAADSCWVCVRRHSWTVARDGGATVHRPARHARPGIANSWRHAGRRCRHRAPISIVRAQPRPQFEIGFIVRPHDIRSRLVRRAAKTNIFIADPLADALAAYYELLTRWNRKDQPHIDREPRRSHRSAASRAAGRLQVSCRHPPAR